MEAHKYTTREKIILSLQGIAFLGSPIVFGLILDMIWFFLAAYVATALINELAERLGTKQHAYRIFGISPRLLCFAFSNTLILLSALVIHFGNVVIPLWQSVILGVVTALVATLNHNRIFHSESANENIKTKHNLRDELAKMSKSQAKEYLYERLPEDEADCIYWLDWERKPFGFVAFNKINRSETALKDLRSSAYKRLSHINPDMERQKVV